MPDGRIEPRQVDVLKKVGVWLDRNGESIYGTRGGPFKPGAYGASTRKGNAIYLHVFQWPAGPLVLPAVPAKVLAGRVMGGGQARVRQTEKSIEISVAEKDRQPADTVVVLDLNGPAERIAAVDMPQAAPKTPSK
jgi:alpha-L-fucosidase